MMPRCHCSLQLNMVEILSVETFHVICLSLVFFVQHVYLARKKKQYRSKESDERLSLEWRGKQMWSSNAYLHFERGTVGEINIAFNLMKQIFSFQVLIVMLQFNEYFKFRIHFFSVSRLAVDFLILVFVIFFCSL